MKDGHSPSNKKYGFYLVEKWYILFKSKGTALNSLNSEANCHHVLF